MAWKNRIIGHSEEDPADLLANPLNFRRHPGAQMDAHRWVAMEEFALDLVILGDSHLEHRGDGSKLADYYCYRKEVKAICEGVVVAARDDVPETDASLRQSGESVDAYDQRTHTQHDALLKHGYPG